MPPKRLYIITNPRPGPKYRAFQLRDNDEVGQFTGQSGDNITALVQELEAETPRPTVYFDDAARLAFYHELPLIPTKKIDHN